MTCKTCKKRKTCEIRKNNKKMGNKIYYCPDYEKQNQHKVQ